MLLVLLSKLLLLPLCKRLNFLLFAVVKKKKKSRLPTKARNRISHCVKHLRKTSWLFEKMYVFLKFISGHLCYYVTIENKIISLSILSSLPSLYFLNIWLVYKTATDIYLFCPRADYLTPLSII